MQNFITENIEYWNYLLNWFWCYNTFNAYSIKIMLFNRFSIRRKFSHLWPILNGPLKCYGPIIWDILYVPWLFKCLKGHYIFYYAKVASKNFESYLRNEMILTGNPIIELCSNLLKECSILCSIFIYLGAKAFCLRR